MATINLFGASGHAKVVMDILNALRSNVGVLYDDSPRFESIHGVRVCSSDEMTVEDPLIISIGSNRSRKSVAERYGTLKFASCIHPSAIVSDSAKIGCGTMVMQGSIIQADVCIGKHCIVNSGASVDHECQIGDYVHISPHATLCGNVSIGEGTLIGAGTTIIPGVKVGKWCTIGAGSVVVSDIPDGATAYGNPSKIKRVENQE